MDKRDIRPAKPWDREVEQALAASSEILVHLSPASVDSNNVMDEVAFALDEKKTVILIIQGECRIPFRLRRLQHVDFRSDYALGLKTLVDTLIGEDQVTSASSFIRELVTPATPRSLQTPKPSISEASLFPLYGITLGKTTTIELGITARPTEAIDEDTQKPYRYYVCNGHNFRYNEKSGLVDQMFLTRYDPIPEPWKELGFQWGLSYDQWLCLLKEMRYLITVEEQPRVIPFDLVGALSAKIVGRRQAPYPYLIELDFNLSRDQTTTSTGTLYSMRLAADVW